MNCGLGFNSRRWLTVAAAAVTSDTFFIFAFSGFMFFYSQKIVLLFPALRRKRSYLTASRLFLLFYGTAVQDCGTAVTARDRLFEDY